MRSFWAKTDHVENPSDALSVPELVSVLTQPAVDRMISGLIPALMLGMLITGLVAGLVAGLIVAALA